MGLRPNITLTNGTEPTCTDTVDYVEIIGQAVTVVPNGITGWSLSNENNEHIFERISEDATDCNTLLRSLSLNDGTTIRVSYADRTYSIPEIISYDATSALGDEDSIFLMSGQTDNVIVRRFDNGEFKRLFTVMNHGHCHRTMFAASNTHNVLVASYGGTNGSLGGGYNNPTLTGYRNGTLTNSVTLITSNGLHENWSVHRVCALNDSGAYLVLLPNKIENLRLVVCTIGDDNLLKISDHVVDGIGWAGLPIVRGKYVYFHMEGTYFRRIPIASLLSGTVEDIETSNIIPNTVSNINVFDNNGEIYAPNRSKNTFYLLDESQGFQNLHWNADVSLSSLDISSLVAPCGRNTWVCKILGSPIAVLTLSQEGTVSVRNLKWNSVPMTNNGFVASLGNGMAISHPDHSNGSVVLYGGSNEITIPTKIGIPETITPTATETKGEKGLPLYAIVLIAVLGVAAVIGLIFIVVRNQS